MAMVCPKCGSTVEADALRCPWCQTALKNTSALTPVAAFAYLLGFVSAIILLNLEPYNRDAAVRFHCRQSIAYSVSWLAVNIILLVFVGLAPSFLSAVLDDVRGVVNLLFAIVWVYLMYQALTGVQYRLPILADWADSLGI